MRICLLAALVLSACEDDRGRSDVKLVTWVEEVAPAVERWCAPCHTSVAVAGSYSLKSYLDALGTGTDGVANAIAGDDTSLLLTVLSRPDHAQLADQEPLLRSWVVDSRLAYRDSRIHAPGLLNPDDRDFHGAELARRGWNFKLCQSCHGEDFGGGTAKAACTTCHTEGPTACTTCHGAIPASGAHRAHVGSPTIDRPLPCSECHVVPSAWHAPGHILLANGAVDPAPAEVVLGTLANRDLVTGGRTEDASYDPTTGRCSAVYCHGGVMADPAAAARTPRWDDGPSATAGCAGCHGAPPATHAQAECAVCHPTSTSLAGSLGATHLDGAIQVGDGSSTCTNCHGSNGNAAPPRGLHGELATLELGVGAHRAHLGPSPLMGVIACSECHLVPTTVDAIGHIDTALPAEVFPPGSGMRARADGAVPTWDRTTRACSNVYCHGGGTRLLATDPTVGVRAPVWTAEQQVYCGSCHGIPPADSYHSPTLTINDCTTCHPDIDAFGNIIVTGSPPTSQHINGTIEFR